MKCFVWLRQPISLFVSTEDWQEEVFELAHGTTPKSRSRPNVHVMFAKVLRRHLKVRRLGCHEIQEDAGESKRMQKELSVRFSYNIIVSRVREHPAHDASAAFKLDEFRYEIPTQPSSAMSACTFSYS
jgi:hypothetical protein